MKPKFSKRVRRCNPSATLEISEMASELEKKGEDVISLGVGEPDFDTPEPIKECCKKSIDDGFVHYTDSQGIEELRIEIMQKLKEKNDISVKKDEVLVTAGAKYAIYLIMQGLIGEGDEVVLFDPAWVSYPETIKLASGKTRWCSTDHEHRPIIEEYKELMNENVALTVLNSPCNPTGKVYSKDRIKKIVEIAKENNSLVLSDEVYEEIIFEKEHYSPAKDFENVITVNGYSKTFSMTGWRLGYLTAQKEIIDNLTKIQQHSVSCPTSFVQKAALCAYNNEKVRSKVKEMVQEFRERRNILVDELKKIPEINCQKPEGTFYAFPEVGIDSMRFSKKALKEANVAVTPGSAFGVEGKGNFRISFANSKERIKEAICRLDNSLNEIISSS